MPARKPRTPRTRDQIVAFDGKTDSGKERMIGELARRGADSESRIGKAEKSINELFDLTTELQEEIDAIGPGGGVSSVTAGSSAVSVSPTTGAVVVDIVESNLAGIPQSGVTNLVSDLAGKVPESRTINISPGTGGGDLSANRTLTVADNSTSSKGVVDIAPNDTTKFWRGDATWASVNTFVSHGTGLDGALVFDGVSTVLDMAPSGGVYTLTRDIFPTTMRVDSGVRVDTANFRIIGSGKLTNNGAISCNGSAASGGTAGAARAAGFYGASTAGSNGASAGSASGSGGSANLPALPGLASNSTANGGGVSSAGSVGPATGRGGGSGGDSLHTGASSGSTTVLAGTSNGGFGLYELLRGRISFTSGTAFSGAGGGAGAPGSGGNQGGGGGGGAGTLYVEAKEIVGTGVFQSIGGAGANGAGTTSGGGGGGGGWLAIVVCGAASGSWTVDVSGGTGGTGGSSGFAGGAGAAGVVICPVTP